MSKPLEERLHFRILRALLFFSSLSSMILEIIILIFGQSFIKLFVDIRDADPTMIRVFAAIECVLCLIAVFGSFLRHFYTFATYTVLLTIYLIGAAIFTRIPFIVSLLLGAILVTLAIIFTVMLWQIKKRKQNESDNMYNTSGDYNY